MKNRISLKWGPIECPADKNYIFLDIVITSPSDKAAYNILNDFESSLKKLIKKETFYKLHEFLCCTAYGDFKENQLYDQLSFDKDFGGVAEQKNEIWELAQEAKRIVLKKYNS